MSWWNTKFENAVLSRFDELEANMSQMHDALLALVQNLLAETKALTEKVNKLAADNTSGEQSMQDVRNVLDETRNEVKNATTVAENALKDDASQGGSTGGGSGAR